MITAGFGFRQNATVESLMDARARAAKTLRPEMLATLRTKATSDAWQAFSARMKLPVHLVDETLARRQATQTQSQASQDAYGTGSVAEATALASLRPGARLLGPRVVSEDGRATCALAEGEPL